MKTQQLTSTFAALFLSMAAIHPAQVQAEGCDSATKVAADIWSDWGDEIKQGGCAAAALLTVIFTQGAAAPEAAGVYEKCYGTLSQFEEISQKIIENWNRLVGNKWDHIGPRPLEANKTLSGTVVSTFGRMFITPAPLPANVDEMDLRLKKLGGNGKTSVTVCKVSANGEATQLWSFTIDSGDDNDNKTWTRTLKGVSGHVVAVHLDGKSAIKKLQYEIRATPKETAAPSKTLTSN